LASANLAVPSSFHVVTPSNGQHVYLLTGEKVGNRAGVLAGVDIRGDGGFVVGPGSRIDGVPYEIINDGLVADAPAWFQPMARHHDKKEALFDDTAQWDDNPTAIQQASDYALHAEPAFEGSGGDAHTFKVCARIREFGVTEETAFALLAEHWNPRCEPPWDADALETKVHNAYRYAQNDAHSADAALDFASDPAALVAPPPPSGVDISWFGETDLDDTPPEQWILGNFLARGRVSALLGAGGIGKSQWGVGASLAIATGLDLIGMSVMDQSRVLLISGEDSLNMTNNRINAWRYGHDLDPDKFRRQFAWITFNGASFKLAVRGEGNVLNPGKDLKWLKEFIERERISTVIVDPWVHAHDADENNNSEVAKVAGMMRSLAFACNCAVLIVHHVRKGSTDPGDMDSGRGASALSGVCRTMATFLAMSEEEAIDHGIDPANRDQYVRFDMAKNNLAQMSRVPVWYKKQSQHLPKNGEDAPYLQLIDIKQMEVDPAEALFGELRSELENGPVTVAEAATILNSYGMFAGTPEKRLKVVLSKSFGGEGAMVDGWHIAIGQQGSKTMLTATKS
jgi:hypothetical protein